MHYYFVWVRSNHYHGNDALTYAHPAPLKTGCIVQVPLQKESVLGVVTGPASKPRFKTREILTVYDLPPLPTHLLKLASWLQAYYPAPVGIITQQLVIASFTSRQLAQGAPLPSPDPVLDGLPPLTAEQATAVAAMEVRDSYLVHGTTGSGKTRVYIELSLKAIENGKSAIILTPEISLTSQLAASFRSVFGERVIVMHSQQAPAERQQAWLRIVRSNQPVIVIGPRSALFSPVTALGLIVIDEAHEAAYKQEQAPQYQTGRVAAYLASLTKSTLVLGSATPAVSDYYLAEQKHKPIIRLASLARHDTETKPTNISIVDRKDHSQFSRSPILSIELIRAIETALARGEQSLLYLNRRGTARLVLCEHCGWQATCPHCDIPLTYHGDSHSLRCHSCNYHSAVSATCPECGHASILFKTAGTKAVYEDIERLFPNARIARFDTDNTKAERFEQQYETVKRGDVDILVGTQLLAKGLDLPKLSTLGIVLADTSLYMPDFSAQERTFQLISQVLGRVGRGHVAGRAIIQTYHPDHPVLDDAINGDYQKFYQRELSERQLYLFPPFCHVLKLSVRRVTSHAAEAAAEKYKYELERSDLKIRVEGPAPSFRERVQNKYQWQLIVKTFDRGELLKLLQQLPANWSSDIDPIDLL